VPIFNVNAQLELAAPAGDAVAATAAAAATPSTAAARTTLIRLNIRLLLPRICRLAAPAAGRNVATLTDISLERKCWSMLAAMSGKAPAATPDVGAVIRRLRTQRGISVRGLAAASGLSASFLGAVERGDSDIALGRLALVAEALDHDVASLLGYSLRQATPRFVTPARRGARGTGVQFAAFRIPGSHLELLVASFAPRTAFADSITHAGIDVAYMAQGEIVLVVDNREYVVRQGQCVVWPSSHPHTMRNDGDDPAIAVGFATEIVH
jgi:transcriptional regulator with XRE-family HTH domain